MKKFLIATAASLLIFCGQVEASTVDNLNTQLETQDMKKWAHFRDKYLLGRETENERRDRKEWERRHRDDYRRDYRRHDDRDYHRHRYDRDDRYYYPPPPPPTYRNGRRYYPPAPPRYDRPSRDRYAPPQPPTRYR